MALKTAACAGTAAHGGEPKKAPTRRAALKTLTQRDWCRKCGDGAAFVPSRFGHDRGCRPAPREGLELRRTGYICEFCRWWEREYEDGGEDGTRSAAAAGSRSGAGVAKKRPEEKLQRRGRRRRTKEENGKPAAEA